MLQMFSLYICGTRTIGGFLAGLCIDICSYIETSSCFFSHRESDANDESGSSGSTGKRQLKLTNIGFTTLKRKSEDIESNAKGRCKFFQARKLEQLSHF